MRFAAAFLMSWLACAAAARAEDCAYDREAALTLSYEAFDLESSVAGWRALADREGCLAAAADLIAAYRAAHAADVDERNQRSLRWHEGQMRAAAGQYDAAIVLFESTRHGLDHPMLRADDLYLDATLAFLRRDRVALDSARAELATLPEPQGFREAVEQARQRYGDAFADSIVWPSNLDVVDGFRNCFDRPYAEAYRECR